jgi:hypothetical protein
MRMTDLRPGWAVVGNDGHRLGTIRDVGQQYVLATTDGRSADLYIPSSAIANVDGAVVYLNLAAREAEEMGWEQAPRDDDSLETTPETDLHRHV